MARISTLAEIYSAYLESNESGDAAPFFAADPNTRKPDGHIRTMRYDPTRTPSARHHSLDRHEARQRKAERFQA